MSDVDYKTGHCSKCGGTHYGSGNKCVYTDEEIREMNEPTLQEAQNLNEMNSLLGEDRAQILSEQPQSQAEEILCIYHSPCQDGFTAAWAMRYLMPRANIRFIPAKYGDAPPDVTDRIVYILDFSYSREVVQDMLNKAKRLLILDHHESAMKNLVGLDCDALYMAQTSQKGAELEYSEGMKFWISDGGHILLDMSRSGAGIAWDYFAALMKDPLREFGKKRPKLLSHVEDRDLWKFEYPETRYICASLFSQDYDFDVWTHLMEGDQHSLESMRDEGEGIMRKQMKDIRELIDKGVRYMTIAGHYVPICNLPYTMASEGCHEMLDIFPNAPFAAAYMDMKQGRVFSLRSTNDRMNVSEVAMTLGGGGHRNASGFTAKHGWEGDEYIYAGQDNEAR